MIMILENEERWKDQGRIMLAPTFTHSCSYTLWALEGQKGKEKNKKENVSVTAQQLPYLILEKTSLRNGQARIWVSVLSTIKSFGMTQGNRSFVVVVVVVKVRIN